MVLVITIPLLQLNRRNLLNLGGVFEGGDRLTPKQAISAECKFCNNTINFHGCSSELCQLNNMELKHIKRIKAHCLTCVPEQNLPGVKDCDGKVTNSEPHICYLHPFRLGKNPKLQAIGKARASKLPKNTLARWQYQKKQTLQDKGHSGIGVNSNQASKMLVSPQREENELS